MWPWWAFIFSSRQSLLDGGIGIRCTTAPLPLKRMGGIRHGETQLPGARFTDADALHFLSWPTLMANPRMLVLIVQALSSGRGGVQEHKHLTTVQQESLDSIRRRGKADFECGRNTCLPVMTQPRGSEPVPNDVRRPTAP